MIEVKVTSDVTEANEPILQLLSTKKMVEQYIKYTDTNTEESALIVKMATAARVACEQFLNMSLAQKTIQVFFSRDYAKRRGWRVSLPYGPVSLTSGDITEVLAVGLDGEETAQTLNTGYYIVGNQFPEIQVFTISGTFPNNAADCNYKLTYTAGYGITNKTESLPESIRLAMEKLFYGWYHNRDNWIPVLTSEAEELLQPFCRRAWF